MGSNKKQRTRQKLEVRETRRLQEQQQQHRMKKKTRVLVTVVTAVVVIFLAAVIYLNTDFYYRTAVAVTVGDEDFTIADFNYYYFLSYSDTYSSLQQSYGDYASYFLNPEKSLRAQKYNEEQTWAEFLGDTALKQMQRIVTLYKEGQAAGFALTAEQQAELEERYKEPAASAESHNMSEAQFYTAAYGRGVNQDVFRKNMEMAYYAAQYSNHLQESYDFSDEELEAYYNEHQDTLDTVTFRSFYISGSPAEGEEKETSMSAAKDKADAMAAAVTDEQSFIEQARENAAESDKKKYEDETATLTIGKQKSSLNAELGEWLFADGRTTGEVGVVESATGFYVVWFGERSDNHYNTVDVRHILVKPEVADSEAGATDKEMDLAKNEAESILKDWQAGDATEQSFAALADEKSDDSAEGGLYEQVSKGQMVAPFSLWCFDEARQPGDTGIVRSTYGYHVMYFVGQSDPYWRLLADANKTSETYNAWLTKTSEKYPQQIHGFAMRFTK